MQQSRPWYFSFLILLMIPFAGIGIDLYAPSLPWIQDAFHTKASLVKLTVSLYLLGYAIGPLLFGALADAYGRKTVMQFGLIGYLLSCVAIIYATNIYLLLIFRFLQGFIIGAVGATSKAMITDTYQGQAMRRMGAMVAVVWGLGPILAPYVGGYLQHYFGWQANFVFLAGFASLIFLGSLLLPETIVHKAAFKPRLLLSRYKEVFSHRLFWVGVLYMGVVYSLIVIFNVVAPFFIQNVLHYNAVQFGHIALVMGFAYFSGGLINRILVNHFEPKHIVTVSLLLMTLGAVVFIYLGVRYSANLYAYTVPLFIIIFCSAPTFPAGMSRVMALFPKMAGTANSLMSFVSISFTATSTALASFLTAKTQIPMALAYAGLIALAFVVLIFMDHEA